MKFGEVKKDQAPTSLGAGKYANMRNAELLPRNYMKLLLNRKS